jgi:glycosidase
MASEQTIAPSRTTEDSALTIWNRTRTMGVELDPHSGLLCALLTDAGATRHPLRLTAALITEGEEVDRDPFGLAYANTTDLSDVRLLSPEFAHEFGGFDELFTIPTELDGWSVLWEYRFRVGSPRLEIQVVLSPNGGNERGTLRNLHLGLEFRPDDLNAWTVEAPGAPMRPGVPAGQITERASFSEPTFNGSGILLLHDPASLQAVLIWPFSRTEHAINHVRTHDGAIHVEIETGLAGRIGPGESLRYAGLELDTFDRTWDDIRPAMHTWFGTLGISRPVDTAEWIPGCTIFEVQIGKSVFWKGFEYSPYPTMRDLYNDLGRIARLGFDCIQIMPRQPFPSYNIYDFSDITTSYGNEQDLLRVVESSHALGMKVILDILMHGVIDADIIHRTADRVRNGPYFARLDEGTEILPDEEYMSYNGQDYLVAWSRHILDFEVHWAGGSPGEHPLVKEHPEWFVRRSDGEIIGVYTKAFDGANTEWQTYFTESALDLVRRLDIDGFRFDAPTYNEVPNWSTATEKRASNSQLGSVDHFARLRPRLKALKPDAMLYTEPSGTLFRQTMDITYNYDEHWLIHSVLRPKSALEKNPLGIRDAHELAIWLRNKEAALPVGAMTSRHIDSHDTFWWPLPGFKWRREQYGLPATRALLATFSLIGGVYMTFVGGEVDLEDDIRRMTRLRALLPEIGIGLANYDAVRVHNEHVFAVAREHAGLVSLILVNLTNASMVSTASFDTSLLHAAASDSFRVSDSWNDLDIAHPGGYLWNATDLSSFSIDFRPYGARVLTIRPVTS